MTEKRIDTAYWLDVRDKPGFFIAVARGLAGDARISFEGNLSNCRELFAIPGASPEPDGVFQRTTIEPLQDYVVLPLGQTSVGPILAVVIPHARIVRDIIHVEIEKAGRLILGAYDNFHRDCVVCDRTVPTEFLDQLKSSGVLRDWVVAKEPDS